jgi:hypothetical protein
MPKLLDLFCGRFGWSSEFAARGWECVGIDMIEPPEIPNGCTFIKADVLQIQVTSGGVFSIREFPDRGPILWEFKPDFVAASSPCEEFSIHGLAHFHPNPKYPSLGIELFNHTRAICEASGRPYIMENVRPAQKFVGIASNHCGPFYLWGNAVPPLMPHGITKGIDVGSSKAVKGMNKEERRAYRAQFPWNQSWSTGKQRGRDTAKAATIPPLLSNTVADYAERILEVAIHL